MTNIIEQNFREKEWCCWKLSIDDIEIVCEKLKIDFNKLDEEDIETIAYSFKKNFEWNNENWAEILEDVIKESGVKENGKM